MASAVGNRMGWDFLAPLGILKADLYNADVQDPKVPFFETYEGQEPVFVLNRDGHIENILTDFDTSKIYEDQKKLSEAKAQQAKKRRQKNKSQKKARRLNRKKSR